MEELESKFKRLGWTILLASPLLMTALGYITQQKLFKELWKKKQEIEQHFTMLV